MQRMKNRRAARALELHKGRHLLRRAVWVVIFAGSRVRAGGGGQVRILILNLFVN